MIISHKAVGCISSQVGSEMEFSLQDVYEGVPLGQTPVEWKGGNQCWAEDEVELQYTPKEL